MTAMNRRRFLAVSSGAALAACASAPPEPERRRPNIVFILADDLGYGEVGCYGQTTIETPNIDRLAAEGMRFTDAYSGATVCAPSRSTLMTGQHTGHTPIRANSGATPLLPEDVTVAELLQQAGYRTGCFGKWGLGDIDTTGVPWEQGFDEFFGYLHQVHAHFFYPEYLYRNGERVPQGENDRTKAEGVYSADSIHEQALGFIRSHVQQNEALRAQSPENRHTPFFAYLPYTLPHGEYQVPDEAKAPYQGRFDEDPMPAKGEHDAQPEPYATYAGMIRLLDRQVGEVVALIDELGVAEDTLIIFTSDNGPSPPHNNLELVDSNGPLRARKGELYEGGIRAPLIARWTGTVASGSESDFPTAFWDFLPTACELAETTPPTNVEHGIDGVSIVPVLTGGAPPEREYLYWEHPLAELDQYYRAARRGKWKAVKNGVDSPLELYDLEADLGETTNVAAEHPDIAVRMAEILEEAHAEARPHHRKWWP